MCWRLVQSRVHEVRRVLKDGRISAKCAVEPYFNALVHNRHDGFWGKGWPELRRQPSKFVAGTHPRQIHLRRINTLSAGLGSFERSS